MSQRKWQSGVSCRLNQVGIAAAPGHSKKALDTDIFEHSDN
jgi:hypothetical protein